jgi:hypothetical protein
MHMLRYVTRRTTEPYKTPETFSSKALFPQEKAEQKKLKKNRSVMTTAVSIAEGAGAFKAI